MKLKLFISSLAICFIITMFSSSCVKKTDCKLVITTHDQYGNIVANANVKLYANIKTASGSTVEADLKAEGVSDGSGTSTYTFKLPAILDVKATYGSTTGLAIVKLEEGKTTTKDVVLK